MTFQAMRHGIGQSTATVHRPRRGPLVQVISPAGFEFNRIELPLPDLPEALDGLRIVHLSDTHLTRKWFAAYDRLIERVGQNSPDLICFTGDLVDSRWDPGAALPVARHLAEGLRARLGTLAVLGNHDGDLLAPHLAGWGWTLLHPGIARVGVGGASIEFVGLPCVARLDSSPRVLRRLADRLGARRAGVPRIGLAHYPDHIRRIAPLEPDVLLTGHTHGGQCCLPGGMPIITHDALPRSMSKGVFRIGRTWLVVSRGFGFATYPVRVCCPGEVCEIVLRRAPEA